MSPASPSLPSSDSRLRWRKRKRDPTPKRAPKPHNDDSDADEDEDQATAAAAAEEEEEDDDRDSLAGGNPNADPALDLREREVLSDAGHRISDFPPAVRRAVNRPHPSVVAVVAAERAQHLAARAWNGYTPFLENISHGQLQALSAVLPDNPSLLQPGELEKPSAYVCTPPPIMEGKGVVKKFGNDQLLVVPMHSDWFCYTTVHRQERQVVPHFFSGKSSGHTPEKYMAIRNKLISKYLENPARRLSFGDCQDLVSSAELFDLSRIIRFLDHWGIINYMAATSVHRGLRMAGPLIKEERNGEINVQTSPLRSIDSLILFDRPKCSLRPEDVALLASSANPEMKDSDAILRDVDDRIQERLSEHACGYCSRPLPLLHYQSQKEVDTILCSDCFHDAKFITGHSSVDFLRVESRKESPDFDVDSWTDQETLLLLEGVEKYNDNWNEIAEHVGTKSKAQCILHFIRLPMEDGLLENIELPHMPVSSESSRKNMSYSNTNGDTAGVCSRDVNSGNHLPFANSINPVMSLVAFLASAIGPRVAATCASASLSVLTKGDPRLSSESACCEVGYHGTHANIGHQKDGTLEDQMAHAKNDANSPLSPEHVKFAAMCGLSAAATKAKLFADQEEREIQRLAAVIINQQLKRLELKLKQFAEVETMLMKECEQVERTRQRFATERVRMMSARFGPTSGSLPAAAGPTAGSTNPRPPAMPAPEGQPSISSAFANNMMTATHPQMPFIQRQPQYSFGPRLPLSAIQPSPSASTQNLIFTSGAPNSSTSNHHPLLRSSGSNTSMG